LQRMHLAAGDVGRLVLLKDEGLVAAPDFGRSAHDDPVLGAMAMRLHRQAGAGIDGDPLHAIARCLVDRVEMPPWTVYLAVADMFGPSRTVELLDHGLQVPDMLAMCDENRILGLDDDEVFRAEGDDEPRFGPDQG